MEIPKLPDNIAALVNGPVGHPEVIAVLERLLADAKAGTVIGVGIIAIAGGGQMQTVTAGAAPPPSLYVGAGMLQQQLLQSMTTPAKPSRILRGLGG